MPVPESRDAYRDSPLILSQPRSWMTRWRRPADHLQVRFVVIRVRVRIVPATKVGHRSSPRWRHDLTHFSPQIRRARHGGGRVHSGVGRGCALSLIRYDGSGIEVGWGLFPVPPPPKSAPRLNLGLRTIRHGLLRAVDGHLTLDVRTIAVRPPDVHPQSRRWAYAMAKSPTQQSGCAIVPPPLNPLLVVAPSSSPTNGHRRR